MEATLLRMTRAIADILAPADVSVYLYGSATMGDFRPGWSDIDLLALTNSQIPPHRAEQLLTLRHSLPIKYPDAIFSRACEGAILPLDTLTNHTPSTCVYWGTSGERLTDRYAPDVFCLWQLHHGGRLLHGPDVRDSLPQPTSIDLNQAVARHLRTILDHGRGSRSLYTFGWLLDTARCLYTVTRGGVISKTAAGEWALAEGLCPDSAAMELALQVRRDPALMQEEAVLRRAEALTPAIAGFAAVLQHALTAKGVPIPG